MTKMTYESVTDEFKKAFDGKTLSLKDDDGNIIGTATVTGIACNVTFNDSEESKKLQEKIEEK